MKTLIKRKVGFDKKIHGFVFKEKGFSFKRSHDFIWENGLEEKALLLENIFCKSGELENALLLFFFKNPQVFLLKRFEPKILMTIC